MSGATLGRDNARGVDAPPRGHQPRAWGRWRRLTIGRSTSKSCVPPLATLTPQQKAPPDFALGWYLNSFAIKILRRTPVGNGLGAIGPRHRFALGSHRSILVTNVTVT